MLENQMNRFLEILEKISKTTESHTEYIKSLALNFIFATASNRVNFKVVKNGYPKNVLTRSSRATFLIRLSQGF